MFIVRSMLTGEYDPTATCSSLFTPTSGTRALTVSMSLEAIGAPFLSPMIAIRGISKAALSFAPAALGSITSRVFIESESPKFPIRTSAGK